MKYEEKVIEINCNDEQIGKQDPKRILKNQVVNAVLKGKLILRLFKSDGNFLIVKEKPKGLK